MLPQDSTNIYQCAYSTETLCLDTIFNITPGHWTLCDGTQQKSYSIDSTTGCITYTSNGIIGKRHTMYYSM
ncbi:MAG: hypothetical protein H6553_10340 [Chitinophagales bacterium]|nr:hypothetical protein [Chitinophagales bacterium]